MTMPFSDEVGRQTAVESIRSADAFYLVSLHDDEVRVLVVGATRHDETSVDLLGNVCTDIERRLRCLGIGMTLSPPGRST